MQECAWGWLIITYLFLAGVGAGAFLVAAASSFLAPDWSLTLRRAGAMISGPLVALGTIFLLLDLEAGLWEPWRQIYLVSNLRSMISWGVIILSLFIPVSLLYAASVLDIPKVSLKLKKYEDLLWYLGSILAISTGGYTGVLIAVANGVPLWNTPLLPVLFLASAISTGLGASLICAYIMEPDAIKDMTNFAVTHIFFLIAEFVTLLLFLFISKTRSIETAQSTDLLISGVFSPYFWGLVVIVGILIPLVVSVLEYLKIAHVPKPVVLTSDMSTLIGGMSLRALIVLAATIPHIIL